MTRPPSESTMSKTLPSIANDGDYREYMEKIMKVEQEADELLNLLNSQLKGRLRKDEDAQTFKNLITDQVISVCLHKYSSRLVHFSPTFNQCPRRVIMATK